MKIGLKLTQSLIPPVHYLLSAVEEGQFSYRYYGIRHPAGIFSNHFLDVLSTFNSLGGSINNTQASGGPCGDEDLEHLRSLTQEFLFQLVNYYECGYEIFLCFCGQHSRPSPGQPLYKWFDRNGYEDDVSSYFTGTMPELKKYRDFFNALKHTSNCVRLFQFLDQHAGKKILGFYLEGVDEKGALGPLLAFHPMYQGSHTAWSYNLHLRNFYFLIYKIAAEMEPVINRLSLRGGASLSLQHTPLVSPVVESAASHTVSNIVNRFETAFGTFFPQEGLENFKTVSIDTRDGSMVFSESPAGNKALSSGQEWTGVMSTRGDGFSRSWNLPYFKHRP